MFTPAVLGVCERAHRISAAWVLLAIALVGVLPAPAALAVSTVGKKLDPGLSAQIVNGKHIYLVAQAYGRENQWAVARSVMVEPEGYRTYAQDPGLRIPLHRLNDRYRRAVVETLFPKDESTDAGWRHRVTYADRSRDGGESLWRIAEWFTGSGANWKVIAQHSGRGSSGALRIGDWLTIPEHALLPAFRNGHIPQSGEGIDPPVAGMQPYDARTPLEFRQDDRGGYAMYTLQRGETLYTDVILRFTDRVSYSAVMDAAQDVARRSSIADVRNISAGAAIKIPIDLLSVDYRPPGDPERREYEESLELTQGYFNTTRSRNLRGITIVLDAGHGGGDPGAIGVGNVYEDEVAYDVMCRVKRILETETAAHVEVLVEDRSENYGVRDTTRFVNDSDEFVLTNPPYLMSDPKVAVNLRWYLANSVYRRALARGSRPEEVLFTSFHADALHPAVYGTMVYIPGARYARGPSGRSGGVYTRRSEVREAQYVSFSSQERLQAEGLSRNFARMFINALRTHDLPIHDDKPVRDVIHRGRYRFVPAVIRQNIIPVKVLVELVNLKNRGDAERIRDPQFRERLARAYVDAVIAYYGGPEEPVLVTQAAVSAD